MIMNGNTVMMCEERVVAYFKVPFRYLRQAAVKITIPQDFRLSDSRFTFLQNPSKSKIFLIKFYNKVFN
jgi:hypothetical protein